eukprot:3075548-Amphidinium_carterae.2
MQDHGVKLTPNHHYFTLASRTTCCPNQYHANSVKSRVTTARLSIDGHVQTHATNIKRMYFNILSAEL